MIQGLHHVTLVCEDAQRTIDFYSGVLGLRFLKQTVNFDAPDTYHLYFGNEEGETGTGVTFFEWPQAPKGHPGIGGTHHFALQVEDRDGLLRWKRRLTDRGIRVTGPLDRQYFTSLYLRDPDGAIVEIATRGPGLTVDEDLDALGQQIVMPPKELTAEYRDEASIRAETWPEPVDEITVGMALRFGMHHISALSSNIERTNEFFNGVLGMPLVKKTVNYDDSSMPHWYWGVDGGRPGTVVTYFEMNPATARRAQVGRGQMHHFALCVPDEDAQLEMRERLLSAGHQATPVIDRVYFKSVYSSDPDGHTVEVATYGPGFLVDEDDMTKLGQELMLPPWLEAYREQIESALHPLNIPEWRSPEIV